MGGFLFDFDRTLRILTDSPTQKDDTKDGDPDSNPLDDSKSVDAAPSITEEISETLPVSDVQNRKWHT